MAKATITPTTSWQQVADGPVVITVTTPGRGNILFNEVGSDTDAYKFRPQVNEQFIQEETKDTFVRISNDSKEWEILTDGNIV